MKTIQILFWITLTAYTSSAVALPEDKYSSNAHLNDAYEFIKPHTFYVPPHNAPLSDKEVFQTLMTRRMAAHIEKVATHGATIGSAILLSYVISSRIPAGTMMAFTLSNFAAQVGWGMNMAEKLFSIFSTGMNVLAFTAQAMGIYQSEPDILFIYEIELMKQWNRFPKLTRHAIAERITSIRTGSEKLKDNLDFLDSIFGLPTTITVPPFYNATEVAKALTGFDPDLQAALSNFVFEKWAVSQSQEDHQHTKKSLFFYGPPGTGKSEAAQKIATLLGLPTCVYPLSEVTVERLFSTNKKSSLITECFVHTGTLNPVLVFEDVSYLLNAPTPASAALKTSLLRLSDAAVREFHDQTLGIPIDISYLTIIYTANAEIFHEGQDFAAFNQRVTSMRFDGFSPDYRRQVIESVFLPQKIAKNPHLNVTIDDMRPAIDAWYQDQVNQEKSRKPYDRGLRTPQLYFLDQLMSKARGQ